MNPTLEKKAVEILRDLADLGPGPHDDPTCPIFDKKDIHVVWELTLQAKNWFKLWAGLTGNAPRKEKDYG